MDTAGVPSRLRDHHGDRRHPPCETSDHRTSQSVVEAAVLPPRLREATPPAPPAYLADARRSWLPCEAVDRPRRCASTPAMRRSCARHRGGDGIVEARRTNQTTRKKGDTSTSCHSLSRKSAPVLLQGARRPSRARAAVEASRKYDPSSDVHPAAEPRARPGSAEI